jgi:hypothetical protein
LRDRRPADKAYAAVVEAAGYYLRLNRHDAEMTKAWTGSSVGDDRCHVATYDNRHHHDRKN